MGYLAGEGFDSLTFAARCVETLGTDRIDLVDLRSANGLLRYRAARDGQVVFEERPGMGDEFRLEMAMFWADAGPVLERAYESVLADLER